MKIKPWFIERHLNVVRPSRESKVLLVLADVLLPTPTVKPYYAQNESPGLGYWTLISHKLKYWDPGLMVQIKFRTEVVGVAIGRIDAEKEKKEKTDVIANMP